MDVKPKRKRSGIWPAFFALILLAYPLSLGIVGPRSHLGILKGSSDVRLAIFNGGQLWTLKLYSPLFQPGRMPADSPVTKAYVAYLKWCGCSVIELPVL